LPWGLETGIVLIMSLIVKYHDINQKKGRPWQILNNSGYSTKVLKLGIIGEGEILVTGQFGTTGKYKAKQEQKAHWSVSFQ